ncbi:MAG: TonB-dependent receptor [Bacteroidales bacterium]|nr:TonB-dependent receptor [Bacteroidales bacterium]
MYMPKGKDVRTEVISAAGLCKMACCSLAESFENSASVTVGYSDAVTGARQIRLLGLSGIYTQMLDENRPVMRGLAAPFGLGYVPGQWLESIQIAKGMTSVTNGVEAITGQINMEHRKPTDEKPFFLSFNMMSDAKADLNLASSLQFNDSWSTVMLGHVCSNFVGMDMNGDGFLDDPRNLGVNLSNRWLYFDPSGLQVRFGVRAIHDSRRGGEAVGEGMKLDAGYDYDEYTGSEGASPWGSRIGNNSIDGYVKVGVPLNEDNSQNVAVVLDYSCNLMDSFFGATDFLASQHSGFANILYMNEINESHKITAGLSATADMYDFDMTRGLLPDYSPLVPETARARIDGPAVLANAGIFGEYTFHYEDKLSTIAALRMDYHNGAGVKVSPRFTLKYTPVEDFVIRANVGRGLRRSNPLVDNIGVFSTSKYFVGNYASHILEDAWVFGGNLTYYLPVGSSSYLSLDYFHTLFSEQQLVDYELNPGQIAFYSLSSLENGRSYTDTFQLDFSIEPVKRFTITLTGRYTNARATYATAGQRLGGSEKYFSQLMEKPMTSRFKGVLNLQYATNLNKWIFDFTASVNGPCRVYDFMKDAPQIKERNGRYYSTTYPLLYFQVTKRFKGVDLYVGAENLTDFRQKQVVFGTEKTEGGIDSRLLDFDASCVWGPIMGLKVNAGLRLTIWKKA